MDAEVGDWTTQAQEFAEKLSSTVRSVAGEECTAFTAKVLHPSDGVFEAVVRQDQDEGIPLQQDGKTLLTLEARYFLMRDSHSQWIRVRESSVKIYPAGAHEPVFRYEYDDSKEERTHPAAHLQVHGSHQALERMLAAGGKGATRSTAGDLKVPNITDLHFPLGGTRLRPCLEDVLEMLIYEFNIDPLPTKRAALDALRMGREYWREVQVKALVRDDLDAASVLTSHGYKVEPPVDPLPRNTASFANL